MNITINGKTYDMPEASTLQDALEAANVKPQGIATALNNHVVTDRKSTRLNSSH